MDLFDIADPIIACECCEHGEYRGQPEAAETAGWRMIEGDPDARLFPWTHLGVCPECWQSGRWQRWGD